MLSMLRRLFARPHVTPEGFDSNELPALLGKPDPVILEIGSNDGGSTLNFLELFPRATVYCFEPDPRARERFAANVHDPRAKLFPVAVSSADGSTVFHASGGLPPGYEGELPKGWDLSGSIRRPTGHLERHPWCKFEETFTVETVRLDTWARAHDIRHVDFIWADVQGAEEDLILGGLETLARTRYFFTEYDEEELYEGQINLEGILKLLPNFVLLRQYPHDVLLKNRNL